MTDTLTFVHVEVPEDMCTLERHPEHGDVIGMTADPDKFPSPAWAEALDLVMADVDGADCDLSKLDGPALCHNHVGWVLHEDDEEPWRSGVTWRRTTLVESDEGIVAVCEDCAPDNLYAAVAHAAREARKPSA